MSHISNPERERIRKLIAGAQAEAVFNALEQAGAPQAPALRTQFHAQQKEYESGRLSLQEWLQAYALMNQDVLREVGVPDTIQAALPARAAVEELVIQHRLEEALDALAPLGVQALLLQSEYALLQQLKDHPATDPAAWELAMMTRLRYGLTQLARELPEVTEATSRSSCFDRLRRFFGERLAR